jgi:hypothetical protein
VLAALGHGRSYGATSRVLVRTLPGILQSGLWRQLEQLPSTDTRALVTDVGNDILYGSSPAEILAWVEEVVDRLQRRTQDIVLTDLPLARIRRLSRPQFLLFRSLLFPSCRLSLSQALETSARVAEGLAALANAKAVRLFPLKPEWYGIDPIHIRPRLWRAAWQEILCGETDETADAAASRAEWLRLYLLRPEQQWLLGRPQRTPQLGRALARGGRVWLY